MKMKSKILSILLLLCVFCVSFCIGSSALGSGDVDADGNVTAGDARLALRYSVELEELSDEEVKRADVNSDGSVTAADARIILRISVGLEKAPSVNEYEIMRSGNFCLDGQITLSDGSTAQMSFAVTKDTVCMKSNDDSIDIRLLIKDGKMYLINDEKEAVLLVMKELMSILGFYPSTEELVDGTLLDFSSYPSFNDLRAIRKEEFNSEECTVYYVRTDIEYNEIYMCGDKLVRIVSYGIDGTLFGDTVIHGISPDAPEEYANIPSSHKTYEGIIGAYKFMDLYKK